MNSSVFWDTTLCRPLKFNGLNGHISQKTELFILDAVKPSNPTDIQNVVHMT
jgi:hypothetical protein